MANNACVIALALLTGLPGAASASAVTDPPSSAARAQPRADAAFSIRTRGNRFVDAQGSAVQLRGVNISGFEFVAIQGWSPADPSGAQAGQAGGPKWSAIRSWKINTVRIPLNEASWLGYPCTDTDGVRRNPDPGGNYRQAVRDLVAQATAAGIYTIVDLHWSAPGRTCPMLQTQMANRDNSLAFWGSVSKAFKDQPSVMFELFNEPFMNVGFSGDEWSYMMKGTDGSFSSYPATSRSGNWQEIKRPWAIASYQAMIDTVRASGASNVVLVGSMQYAQDLSEWLEHRPTDPLNQMAAVWHPYSTFGAEWGTPDYAQPNFAPDVFDHVLEIKRAGFPVVATETGDRNTPGTHGAPLVANITRWADRNQIGVLGWAWAVWQEPAHVLIKDAGGTPTDGYGEVFRDWLVAH